MTKHTLLVLLALIGAVAVPNTVHAALRSDIVAHLEVDPSATTIVVVDGSPVNSTIRSGTVVLEATDPNCDPRIAPPCSYTLKHLDIQVTNFSFDGDAATDGQFVTGAPLTVVDNGGGIVIPAGTPVGFGVFVAGNREGATGSVAAPVTILVDVNEQEMTLAGAFQGSLAGHSVNAMLAARAQSPFINVPPKITIQKVASVLECDPVPAAATVSDATVGDFVLPPTWSVDGVGVGFGLSGLIPALAPGAHVVRATADDSFGAEDVDSFSVNVQVDNLRPVFTFVPSNITTSSCGGLNIGIATATDNCRALDVTNDAPAHFAAGTTVVTWTARDARGNVSTATQVVTVTLKDDASCCPVGSHVIIGTSNNDNLVGTSGPDCILGLGGQDVIDGAGGDDVISGGDGDDILKGSAGNDLIYAGSGQDQLFGGDGNDLLSGDDGDDKLFGDNGVDTLLGGQGQDQIHGGAGNDILNGGTGDDTLFGDDGDDSIDGAEDNDTCTGGTGFDTMLSCAATDTVENPGPPGFVGDASYQVCSCKPNKCGDCSTPQTQCTGIPGCAQIIECIQSAANCNLPSECSSLCESGRSAAAINAARQLASCFGGC